VQEPDTLPPVILIVDAHRRVSLRLHLLDPERKEALWQIRAALGSMGARHWEGIREAFTILRFVRESSWPLDGALRAVEVAHGKYINEHCRRYGDR